MMKRLSLMLLLAGCASPDRPATPEAQRNMISAGMGVASILTDCGDGMQRDTRGAGIGFILTGCPRKIDEPRVEIPEGTGILSVGLGVAFTISDCAGFRLSGLGLGLGVVTAPCPHQPQSKS